MTQGREANHSGQFLENVMRTALSPRGFVFRAHGKDADNLDMFNARVVVTNTPYRNLYGKTSRSEYVITDKSRKVRVECRWQEVSGSVDEKFPYLLENAIHHMPELEVLILYGGGGAKKEAIQYAKRRAQLCTRKKIYVLSVDEMPRWVRDNFGDQKAAA